MSSPVTAVGNIQNLRTIIKYSTGASFNNLPASSVFTSSVIRTDDIVSQAGLLVKVMSGSATSLGTTPFHIVGDYSGDGISGWHGLDTTSVEMEGFTGSSAVLNKWIFWNFTRTPLPPYMRILLQNQSGSALSGSIVAFGSIY